MNRYLTTADCADIVLVFTESDDYKTAIDNAQEWVWQYAPDKETARKQHFDKHDQWSADQQAGRPEKRTY